MDYISHNCMDILSSIRVNKITTCLTDNLPILNQDINCYKIKSDRNKLLLKVGEDLIKTKDIIKSIYE